MAVTIGIPRGLMYYYYGAVWEDFLTDMGAKVVISRQSTQKTLNEGSILDDVCLPVKVYMGHTFEIINQVDYIFVPRVVSVAKSEYSCPKILGLPDMLKSNISSMPRILDYNINLREQSKSLYQAVINAGSILDKNRAQSMYAWTKAWYKHRANKPKNILPDDKVKVALIAHPYLIYDSLISMDVLGQLQRLGAHVLTPEIVSEKTARRAVKSFHKKLFWTCASHLAGSAITFIKQKSVNGIIFLTSFGCGPDSLTGELIKHHAIHADIPFLMLTVDEHTAQAGIVTRIEAFMDMLIRRLYY